MKKIIVLGVLVGVLATSFPATGLGTAEAQVSTSFSVGDRIVVIDNANVRIEPNGNLLGTQYGDISYSGFRQFAPARGVIMDGPRIAGGYTWMKVNYDYGPDGWSAVDYLSSLGQVTSWEFTGDNVLGRKIQPSQGSSFVEVYYYYVENGQVSIPSDRAQSSLDVAGQTAAIGGAWNCQSISDAPPFRWVGYRCSYRRGNQPPSITSFTGSTNLTTGANGSWQFTATDPEGALASYEIDWKDGTTKTSGQLTGGSANKADVHVYTQAGNYNISLKVTDAGGLSAMASAQVAVTVPCSTRFNNNDRIRVINAGAENPLNVRSSPVVPAIRDANKLGGHYAGDLGTIIGGPTSGNGYCWWNVDYDVVPKGWSAEGGGTPLVYWLEKIGSTPTVIPPLNPITPPGTNTGDPTYTDPGPQGNYSTAGAATSNLASGDLIRVVYVLGANVREAYGLNGRYITTKEYFSSGKVTGQPVSADGLTWWYVDFDIPPDGWVAEKNQTGNVLIAKYVIPPPLPPSDEPVTPPPPPPDPAVNVAPVLDPLTAPTQVTRNINTTWQVRATDANGDSLTYTVNWGDGTAVSTFSGKASGVSVPVSHAYTTIGSKTITVTVSDGQLISTPQSLTINVVASGGSTQGPSSQISGPQTPVVGVQNTWQIVAYDPDSASISFTVNWGDGTTNNYNGAPGSLIPVAHTYTQIGMRTISVVATDNTGLTHGSSWGINVVTAEMATAKPSVPVITGPTQVIAGTNTSWTVTLRDPDTNSLTYTLNWNDGTAIINGTAVNGVPFTISHIYPTVFVGYKSIVIIVSDGNSTESGMINILAKPGNQPPTVSSIVGAAEIDTGVTGLWKITGSDPEAGVLTYTVNWGEGGSNTYTGASGNHVYAQAGSFIILVTATDNGGLTATKTFTTQAKVVTAVTGSVKFKVNDSVEVMPDNSNLAMRALPKVNGYWIIGRNAVNRGGVRGVVVGGPVAADGFNWWKIKWNDNFTGWSAENWLQKVPATPINTLTIKVGQYAPLFNHVDLPPKGNPSGLVTFTLNGRTWTWRAASNLWQFTSGPDLTIQY